MKLKILLLNNNHVCLLGDFNAHTSTLKEYVDMNKDVLDNCNVTVDDISSNNADILVSCNIPLCRSSQDLHRTDRYGRRLLQLCGNCDLFFVNGRVGADQGIGRTTCNQSVLDYAIVSPNMFKVISDFNILDFDPILRDIHSPVSLSLCTKGEFDS